MLASWALARPSQLRPQFDPEKFDSDGSLLDKTALNQQRVPHVSQEFLALPLSVRRCAFEKSHGQFGEELLMMPYLFMITGGRPGTYVEIGALDGIKYANTLALEHCLGWHGLLIEGNRKNCKALGKYMAYRPNSRRECSAVCDKEIGVVNFTKAGSEYAGMPETMDKSFVDQWGVYMGSDTVQVPCTRMGNLMARGERPMQEVDFLSLDVEGAEEFVLKASPISSFKMMVVETGAGAGKGGRDGEDVDDKRSRILGMLLEAGFVKPTFGPLAVDNRIENNEVFIRHDVDRQLAARLGHGAGLQIIPEHSKQ